MNLYNKSYFIAASLCISFLHPIGLNAQKNIVIQSPYSCFIHMTFENSITVKSTYIPNQHLLRLEIDGISPQSIDLTAFNTPLQKQQQPRYIKSIHAYNATQHEKNTTIDIYFEPIKMILKWYKEKKHPIIRIEILTEQCIKNLHKNGADYFSRPKNIIIDPGHGGSAPGAVYFGIQEKDLNLSIAEKTRTLLEKNGFNVSMTRTNDQSVSLSSRVERAQKLNADFFLTIHSNASDLPKSPKGLEVYYAKTPRIKDLKNLDGGYQFIGIPENPTIIALLDKKNYQRMDTSKKIADQIRKSLKETMRPRHLELKDRGTNSNPYVVLVNNTLPAVLLECGYMSCKEELENLTKTSYQQAFAEGIVKTLQAIASE